MTIPHSHELDGQLHDDCPNCDLIRSKQKRDQAHRQVDDDLKRIAILGEARFQRPKRKRTNQ